MVMDRWMLEVHQWFRIPTFHTFFAFFRREGIIPVLFHFFNIFHKKTKYLSGTHHWFSSRFQPRSPLIVRRPCELSCESQFLIWEELFDWLISLPGKGVWSLCQSVHFLFRAKLTVIWGSLQNLIVWCLSFIYPQQLSPTEMLRVRLCVFVCLFVSKTHEQISFRIFFWGTGCQMWKGL